MPEQEGCHHLTSKDREEIEDDARWEYRELRRFEVHFLEAIEQAKGKGDLQKVIRLQEKFLQEIRECFTRFVKKYPFYADPDERLKLLDEVVEICDDVDYNIENYPVSTGEYPWLID